MSPTMGFLEAQQELTILTIVIPILYVALYTTVHEALQMSTSLLKTLGECVRGMIGHGAAGGGRRRENGVATVKHTRYPLTASWPLPYLNY